MLSDFMGRMTAQVTARRPSEERRMRYLPLPQRLGLTDLGNPSRSRVTLTTPVEKDLNSGLLQRGHVKKGLNSGLS